LNVNKGLRVRIARTKPIMFTHTHQACLWPVFEKWHLLFLTVIRNFKDPGTSCFAPLHPHVNV